MHFGYSVPSLQSYAQRALQGASERSRLALELSKYPANVLQDLVQRTLQPAADDQPPEALRRALYPYWNSELGLSVSYSAQDNHYSVRYLRRCEGGFEVASDGCPADAKLATLLLVVRHAEHVHFCAVAGRDAGWQHPQPAAGG